VREELVRQEERRIMQLKQKEEERRREDEEMRRREEINRRREEELDRLAEEERRREEEELAMSIKKREAELMEREERLRAMEESSRIKRDDPLVRSIVNLPEKDANINEVRNMRNDVNSLMEREAWNIKRQGMHYNTYAIKEPNFGGIQHGDRVYTLGNAGYDSPLSRNPAVWERDNRDLARPGHSRDLKRQRRESNTSKSSKFAKNTPDLKKQRHNAEKIEERKVSVVKKSEARKSDVGVGSVFNRLGGKVEDKSRTEATSSSRKSIPRDSKEVGIAKHPSASSRLKDLKVVDEVGYEEDLKDMVRREKDAKVTQKSKGRLTPKERLGPRVRR